MKIKYCIYKISSAPCDSHNFQLSDCLLISGTGVAVLKHTSSKLIEEFHQREDVSLIVLFELHR